VSAAYRDKYGPWALVAGASEGIGAAFATELARGGLDVVLVARRAEPLEALAATLRTTFGVQVRVASIDLASPDLLEAVRFATAGLEIGLLVYNAAYSMIGPFLDQPLADKLRILDVNCRAPVILADELGRAMVERGRGGIILMASIAGAQGSAFITTYAASKAFDLVLAEGLWDELRERGVDVLGCRAGATRTPAYEKSKPAVESGPVMEPEAVAVEALAALGKKPSMIAGTFNGMAAFFMGRVMSRKRAVMTMGRAMRKMYR
jgi:short-subunit dehydrogenase